jgi:hypothetical protein
MAEPDIGLGVEELPSPARVSVCGLSVERSRIVFNHRLRAVGALQRVGIKTVLKLEDRPVRDDRLDALEADMRLPKPVRYERESGSIAVLRNGVSTPLG